MAKQKDLRELFHDTLKDIYFAEKKILSALPKMAKAAQAEDLKEAFEKHEEETQGQVERLEKVRIGGIDQWVSIRGADSRNPVLLYIHGGPGYVSIPMSWWFTHGLEEYFTVVQWDQRATGKTYLLTDPVKIAPTLTRNA